MKEGDIIELPSKVPNGVPLFGGFLSPIVKHYGIIVNANGKKYVLHNAYGEGPRADELSLLLKEREAKTVLETGLSTPYILKKYDEIKHLRYNFFTFNCEDFITYICKCDIGIDQRRGWSVLGLGLLILIIIFIANK